MYHHQVNTFSRTKLQEPYSQHILSTSNIFSFIPSIISVGDPIASLFPSKSMDTFLFIRVYKFLLDVYPCKTLGIGVYTFYFLLSPNHILYTFSFVENEIIA